jgi:hypothetical protein
MSQHNWWARVWKLHASKGEGANLIAAGNKFWLEPVHSDGSLAYFNLCFVRGEMNECFKHLKLYPVGVIDPQCDPLPLWNEHDPVICKQHMDTAIGVRKIGYDNPLIKRLEGTFWAPDKNDEPEHEIARFYFLPRVECNRDWFVFDIISPASHKEQDGTGHGDEE